MQSTSPNPISSVASITTTPSSTRPHVRNRGVSVYGLNTDRIVSEASSIATLGRNIHLNATRPGSRPLTVAEIKRLKEERERVNQGFQQEVNQLPDNQQVAGEALVPTRVSVGEQMSASSSQATSSQIESNVSLVSLPILAPVGSHQIDGGMEQGVKNVYGPMPNVTDLLEGTQDGEIDVEKAQTTSSQNAQQDALEVAKGLLPLKKRIIEALFPHVTFSQDMNKRLNPLKLLLKPFYDDSKFIPGGGGFNDEFIRDVASLNGFSMIQTINKSRAFFPSFYLNFVEVFICENEKYHLKATVQQRKEIALQIYASIDGVKMLEDIFAGKMNEVIAVFEEIITERAVKDGLLVLKEVSQKASTDPHSSFDEVFKEERQPSPKKGQSSNVDDDNGPAVQSSSASSTAVSQPAQLSVGDKIAKLEKRIVEQESTITEMSLVNRQLASENFELRAFLATMQHQIQALLSKK